VVNHILNLKRGRAEAAGWTFSRYGESLDATPDMELPDPNTVPDPTPPLPATSHAPQSGGPQRKCLSVDRPAKGRLAVLPLR
jgi:hypothetical protein